MGTNGNPVAPAPPAPEPAPHATTDYVIVGSVETCAPLLGLIYVRTSRGALVRVTTTPLTVLRSRRRRGLAWSETKFVRLCDVAEGGRILVRGTPADGVAALRAAVVLVGDIGRYLWCTVAAYDEVRNEVELRPADATPITVELASRRCVREIRSAAGFATADPRHVRQEQAFDERALARCSREIAPSALAAGDRVLALVEPAPTLGRARAVTLVRIVEPWAPHGA